MSGGQVGLVGVLHKNKIIERRGWGRLYLPKKKKKRWDNLLSDNKGNK